jgi:hypothetical protein
VDFCLTSVVATFSFGSVQCDMFFFMEFLEGGRREMGCWVYCTLSNYEANARRLVWDGLGFDSADAWPGCLILFVPPYFFFYWWIYSGHGDTQKISVVQGAARRTISKNEFVIRRVGFESLPMCDRQEAPQFFLDASSVTCFFHEIYWV